jgi:hypothetical protein
LDPEEWDKIETNVFHDNSSRIIDFTPLKKTKSKKKVFAMMSDEERVLFQSR